MKLVAPHTTPVDLPLHRGGVFLDLGVSVTPVGGDLVFHVVRPDYDSPLAIRQVAKDGTVLQTLPTNAINGWQNLRRFFRITLSKPGGPDVLTVFRPFCPNTWSRVRVDDTGPILSRYPTTCRSFSPFLRGMVWGIDEGWAVPGATMDEFEGTPRRLLVRLRPGAYVAKVEVSPYFQTLLGVAPENASVTVDVVVRKARYFGARAPEGRLGAGSATAAPPVPLVTDPDPDTVPNLGALPAWLAFMDTRGKREYISFASTTWNGGPAPLVVEGFRRPGTLLMDAYQYFTDSHGVVVGRAEVGTFEYDTRRGHHHWHIPQFVRYSIVDTKTNEVVRSMKQSFCLAPTDPIDLTVPRAVWSPYDVGLSSVCGDRSAGWIREVLPTGWGDTYFQGVAGQAFDVTTLPNGRYRIRIHVNPLGVLHEATTADNVEDRYFTLKGRKPNRRIEVDPWHGIDL